MEDTETTNNISSDYKDIVEKTVIPPPFVPRADTLDEVTAKLPGYVELDEHGKLFKKYLSYQGIAGYLVEHYNHWVGKVLPKQIESAAIYLSDKVSRIRFINPNPIRPEYTSGAKKYPLYPARARLEGLTYSFEIYATPVREVAYEENGKIEWRIEEVYPKELSFGRIPAMVRSKMCNLDGKSDEELIQLGEDPDEPIGYFIIKGTERSTLLQEMMRLNRMYLSTFNNKGEPVCRITVPTPSGSTSVMQLALGKDNKMKFLLQNLSKISHKETTTRSEEKRKTGLIKETNANKGAYKGVNAIMLVSYLFGSGFDFIGDEKREEFEEYIKIFTRDTYDKSIGYQIIPTLFKCAEHLNPIKYFAKKFKMIDAPEDEVVEQLEQLIEIDVFPNMNGMPNSNYRKGIMCLTMITSMAEHLAGKRKLDNKNNWTFKRLRTSADMMQQLFTAIYRQIIRSFQDKVKEMVAVRLDTLETQFKRNEITDVFVNSFNTSNWGVPNKKIRTNVSHQVERFNRAALFSFFLRIDVGTSREGTQIEPRSVNLDGYGNICPSSSSEGKNCGLVKDLSPTVYITLDTPEEPVVNLIQKQIDDTYSVEKSTKLIINAKFYGFCDGMTVHNIIVKARRQLYIHRDTCVYLEGSYLYVFTDSARLVRPLLIVDDDGYLVIQKKNLWGADFNTLLSQGCVEMIDVAEQKYIHLANSIDEVNMRETLPIQIESLNARLKSEVLSESEKEKLKLTISELNEKLWRLSKRPKFTHCELDPSSILGLTIEMIPYANHNQGPRNTYQGNMGKQAQAAPHPTHMYRFEGNQKTLSYPEQPLLFTQADVLTGIDYFPQTTNLMVAIMPLHGFTQEDAFIVNKSSLDTGKLRITLYYTIKVKIQSSQKFTENLQRPPLREGDSPERYKYIGANGLPAIYAPLGPRDCVVGIVQSSRDNPEVKYNKSVYLKASQEGIVTDIRVTNSDEGIVVHVKLRSTRMPIEGDKLAPRHAQKGTIGLILPPEDMPFDQFGVQPDILIDPHSIPSRMTMAYIYEILFGREVLVTGRRRNATPFRKPNAQEVCRTLAMHGIEPQGMRIMYSGITGMPFQSQIFMGPAAFQSLKHLVTEKVHACRTAPRKIESLEPIGGKKVQGALRSGEMENFNYFSHGAITGLFERIVDMADGVTIVVCKTCGTIAQPDYLRNKFICRRCSEDEASFGRITVPMALLRLFFLAGTTGVGQRFYYEFADEFSREVARAIIYEEQELFKEDDENPKLEENIFYFNDEPEDV